MNLSLILFAVSVAGIASVFVLYPLLILLLARIRPRPTARQDAELPSVSLLVVVRNGAGLIDAKLTNALSLDYPNEKLEIVVFSDGSHDATEQIIERFRNTGRVTLLATREHAGKAAGINRAASSCTGEIILFSDADALLDSDAVKMLVSHFSDPDVGGVCGQRRIGDDNAELKEAQRRFIRFDSGIKLIESKIGSISSNDGKIYAIRSKLFQPIAEAVTDDLYACLTIIRQKYRFVFEPRAVARIHAPSRSPGHELRRRRRIVCRGLRGIWLMRELLNPFRFGIYSLSIFCNKILRRILPLFIITLGTTTVFLAFEHTMARLFLAAQLAFALLALAYPLTRSRIPGAIERMSSVAFYFCLGIAGSLLGVADFLRGKKVVQWNPIKQDAH